MPTFTLVDDDEDKYMCDYDSSCAYTLDEIKCPYCGETLEYPGCKHVMFIYDGTNGEFDIIDPGFFSEMAKTIKANPECWDCIFDEEEISIYENEEHYWVYHMHPPVRELEQYFPGLDLHEICDSDSRSYYMGVIYGIRATK